MATMAEHGAIFGAMLQEFDGAADIILSAGPSAGAESTLVDAPALPIRVLREGALSARDILEALKQIA